LAQNPKAPQEPSAFIEPPRNASKEGLFIKSGSQDTDTHFNTLIEQTLAPFAQPAAAQPTYLDDIGGDAKKASLFLRRDPRIKQDIIDVAKAVNGVDLSGKTQEEVADWLLNERRTELGSLAMAATEAYKTNGMGDELSTKYARLRQLYELVPNFDGGVGKTLTSVGKAALPELAASYGIGTVGNIAARGLMATEKLVPVVAGKSLDFVSKYVLLGSASSDAAKLAAQKAIASGATKSEATLAATKAGAIGEMPAGAIYGGAGTAIDQNIEQDAGMREGYDALGIGAGAAVGAALGAGIGTVAHGLGGAYDANKYAKRMAKINGRTIDEFTPTQLVQQYSKSLDNQKDVLEKRITELKNSNDPVDIEEMALRTQDLVDIETQRAGLKSLNLYPDQRKAFIGDIANKQTPDEVDNILNGVDALDDAYDKIIAATDINDVHDSLTKFGTQYNIDAPTVLQALSQQADPAAPVPPAAATSPATPATPAAPTQTAATTTAPATPEEVSPLQALNEDASKAADKLDPEPSTAVSQIEEADTPTFTATTAAQDIAAMEDELLGKVTNLEKSQTSSTPASTSASTQQAADIQTPETSTAPKARKKRADFNKDVAKAYSVDDAQAAKLIDDYVAANHSGTKRPTNAELATYVSNLIDSQKRAEGFAPVLNELRDIADTIINDMVDTKNLLPAKLIVKMLEGRLAQVAPSLLPKQRELLLQEMEAHVKSRITLILDDLADESLSDFVAGIKLDQDALAALARDIEDGVASAVDGARVDKITYSVDDFMENIPPSRREELEPKIRDFARKLALQIKREHNSLPESQKKAALRALVKRKIEMELSLFPSQDKSALDTSEATVFTDNDGNVISGRNQSKNMRGIVEVGDTQRILREAEGGSGTTDYTWDQRNGGDNPRVSRSDNGAPVGAIEAARRAIYRAATLKAGKGSGRLVAVKDSSGKPILETKKLRLARVGRMVEGRLFTNNVMMDNDGTVHFTYTGKVWVNKKGESVNENDISSMTVQAPKLRYVDKQPRVAESAIIRELTPEIGLARKEGNTTQYALIDLQTKEVLSDVPVRDARSIELYTAVEGYISGFAPSVGGKPQTPEQAFMRVIDTINQRYGRKVTEEETRDMMRSVMRGENIFETPKAKRPKADRIELADVLPPSRDQLQDTAAAARTARGIAISRASLAFAKGELTEPQLFTKLEEIHALSDDEILKAAYKKIQAENAVTQETQAASLSAKERVTSGQTEIFNPTATPDARRVVNAADLDSTPEEFYSPRSHVTVLKDNKGRIRKMFKGKSIRDVYGDEALGWEIGFTPFKARNSAVAEVAFKNLATVDQPLRPMSLDEMAKQPVNEGDLSALSPTAFARLSDSSRGKDLTLRTVFDTITDMESAPWATTYSEFTDYINDYRALTNLLSSKTPNGIKLTTVYRTTAKRAISEIFSTSHPTDLVFLNKLLDNLGGNRQFGPMVSRTESGSMYVPPSETGFEIRENSILIGDRDGALRAYSFTHEIAHWGFRNILSFEDRLKFLEMMDKYYKAKTGEVDIDAIDGILPDMAANRLDSPQELFANQFTQWLFSQNKVFGGQQYAKSAFSDAANESIVKGFATKFKEAIKRIVYGKATRKGGDVDVVDEDFVPFFEQIMSTDEVRPSRVTIKPENLKNEKSLYYLNMVNRLDERRVALEEAIQSFNPVALNDAIKDSLMFVRWMLKNSKSIKLYSQNLYSHMKVSTDANVIETILEFHRRQESFEGLPDYQGSSTDDISRIEDTDYVDNFSEDMTDAYESRPYETYDETADIYTANADLVSEQQKAALRLQNVIDFAISQAARSLKKMEERDVSPSISKETDLASMLAEVQVAEKAVPSRTDKRTTKQLHDALKLAITDNDMAEVSHIVENLEYRGAAKLHFNESAVREDVARTIQSDGSVNTNFRSTPQERELLNSINHRDLKTATEMRLLASRILSYNGIGRTKPITNAELAAAIGEESFDSSIATTSSPEFTAFRNYVKKRYEARNLWHVAPFSTANNFDTDASSFSSGNVAAAFDELLNTNVSVSVRQIADFAVKNSREVNPAYAVLLKRIKDLDFINNMQVIKLPRAQFESVHPRAKRNDGKQVLGFFIDAGAETNSTIYLADDIGSAGDTMSILMHEVVHAAALSYMARDSRQVARLNSLYNEVLQYVDALGLPRDSYYGLTNPDEFLAEAFTNGQFQEFLSNIFYDSDKSIFSKFIQWMSELLNIQDDTALLRAIRVGDSLFRENKANKDAMEKAVMEEAGGMFSTQDYFSMRGMTDSPISQAYETPKGVNRILQDDRIPPILGGAIEQEVGRPVFFKGRNNKFTLKPESRIPDTAAGKELKAIDNLLYETYTRIEDAADRETKSILKERFDFLMQERKAVAKTLGLPESDLYAEPVVIETGSLFRLDDKYQYVKEELYWMAADMGKDALARLKEMPDLINGAQIKRLFGEEAILTVLKKKGIGSVTLGRDANEITLVNSTPEPARPKLKVDQIVYGSGEPSAPISLITPVVGSSRNGGAFSAIATLAQQQGAPSDVVSGMKRVFQGKPPTPEDRSAFQKVFDLTSENSGRLRAIGMKYIADFIKPENGVGINEVHASELAKRIVPVFNKLHQFQDSKNIFKRWARKSNPFAARSAQPESHKRIVEALRRGDIFSLESKEEREVFKDIQTLFQKELEDMRAEGIQIGDVKLGKGINGYVPQVWDADAIASDPNAFIDAFTTWFVREGAREGDVVNPADARVRATNLMKKLSDDANGVVADGFGYAEAIGDSFLSRTLRLTTDDLNALGLEKFMVNDLEGLMAKYFDATTRRRIFHKKFGIKDHAFNAYKEILTGRESAVTSMLNSSKAYTNKRTGIMPDGNIGLVEDEIPFIPTAIKSAQEAYTEAQRLYEIARTKDRSIAIPEIESSILRHYDRFVESGYYPEIQKRAAAMANGIVESLSTNVTRDNYNFLENAYAVSQNRMLMHGAGSDIGRKASSAIRTFNSVTLLTFTTIASFSDPAIALMRGGNFKAWAKAMAEYTAVPEYREASRRIGATISSVLHERLSHVYGNDSSKLGNAFFNATLLTPWTMRMRELTTVIGFEALRADAELAQRLAVKGNTNSRAYRLAKRRLDYYGLGEYAVPNMKTIGDITTIEDDDKWRYALMKFANETIFEPNNNDVPVWAQTPIGKMVYQLKSFPHMMARTVMKSYKQQELEKFLLPFLVVGPAMGAASISVRDHLQSRGGEDERSADFRERKISKSFSALKGLDEDTDAALGWYMESMLAFGGLGLFADLIYQASEQADNGAFGAARMTSAILGPSLGTVEKGINIYSGLFSAVTGDEKMSAKRSAVRSATSMVPFVGGNRAVRENVTDFVAPLNDSKGGQDNVGGFGSLDGFSLEAPEEQAGFGAQAFELKPFGEE
jgi:hypothetical protein